MQNIDLRFYRRWAEEDASSIANQCDGLAETLTNGPDTSERKPVADLFMGVMRVVLGLAALLLGVVTTGGDRTIGIGKFLFPRGFVAILLLAAGGVLAFSGGIAIYKAIMRIRRQLKAKAARSVGKKLTGEVDTLDAFEEKLRLALERGEDMEIKPKACLETQFLDLQKEAAEGTRKDDRIKRMVYTIAFGLLFVFAAIAMYPFVVGGYLLRYNYASGAMVAIAYILLMLVVTEGLKTLDRWYRNRAKWIACAAFGGYQLLVILNLLFKGVFSGGFAALLSYPVISLLTITVLMVLMILLTKYDLIAAREFDDYVTVEYSDGTTAMRDRQGPRVPIVVRAIVFTWMVIVMGNWIAYVDTRGLLLVVLNYLLCVGFSAVICHLPNVDDDFNFVYGSLATYMRLMYFAAYLTVVLSLDPVDRWADLIVKVSCCFCGFFVSMGMRDTRSR